jgi:Tfp pilus assembly protein PilN
MKIINLLPNSEQKEIQREFLFRRVVVFWVLVWVSMGLLLTLTIATKIYLNKKISDTKKEITNGQNTLNSSDYRDLQKQVLQLNGSIKEVNNLITQHYYWSKSLVALADLIPSDVQLNQVVLDRETGRIDISGQAQNRDSIIKFWSDVIKSDYFHDINFPLANLEKPKIANFTFTFYVNKDKVAQP